MIPFTFLAKYRQELKANDWKIKRSVYATLKEAGISMFYTSVVLFLDSQFYISRFWRNSCFRWIS